MTPNPWLAIPAAIAFLLVVARLARLRPNLRPLLLPLALLLTTGSILVALERARIPEGWPGLAVLVPLLMLMVRGVSMLMRGVFQRSQGEPPPALLDSVVSVLLYGVGIGVVAHQWFGVELTPFLATSAVVGAVVGLALQDTLGNLFAGIALHTETPFRAGDWVRLADRDARVEQVSWRAVRLRTWDGDTLTIPNNEVGRHAILNYSWPSSQAHSRVLVIGVSYATPPNKVLSVLAHLVAQVPGVPQEPAVRIVGYDDFAIRYEVRYLVPGYQEYRRIEGEILRLVWYHFRRHSIEIPFPIRNVYLHHVETVREQGDTPAARLERALRAIDLFVPLGDDELRACLQAFRYLHYAAGERIIQEGSPGDSFFVIDRGEVEVLKELGGAQRPLARLMEGQFFGEMALLTGEKRTATVVAVTDVDLFTIDKAGFHDILAGNPAIAVDISAILAERREALSQAEGDETLRTPEAAASGELRGRILDRMRTYFGI